MRAMLIKVIAFLAIFIFLEGMIVPWIISTDWMPLWVMIIILALIMMAYASLLDLWVRILSDKFKDKTDDIK